MPIKHPCLALLSILLTAGGTRAADPPWYVRADTWQATMRLSREALASYQAAHRGHGASGPRYRLGPWYSLGPLPVAGRGASAPPPLAAVLGSPPPGPAEPPPAASTAAAAGAQAAVRWQLHLDYRDAWINRLHAGEHVVYLRRGLTAARQLTVPAYVDATGELAVWLNGRPVLAPRRGRISFSVWGPDPTIQPCTVQLPLRPGRNDLVMRIVLHPGRRPRSDQDPWRAFTAEARRPWGTVFTGYSVRTGPATDYEAVAYGQVSQFYFSTHSTLGPQADAGVRARQRLWQLLGRDFTGPEAARQMRAERSDGIWRYDWTAGDFGQLAARYAGLIRAADLAAEAARLAAAARSDADLARVRALYYRWRRSEPGRRCLADPDYCRTVAHQIQSLRLAIEDLTQSFGSRYRDGKQFLERVGRLQRRFAQARAAGRPDLLAAVCQELERLRYQALLANPLLDFDRLLLVKRRANPFVPALPMNWASNSSLPKTGHDNQIAVLSPVRPDGDLTTLYRPDGGRFVGDLDLHFDADRLLFSMPGSNGCWQVFEIRSDGTGLRQVSKGTEPDVDNFDPCYLPNGDILFCSTATFAGVPCVRGRDHVAVIYRMDPDGGHVRQLCFEQDQDWCPTVLPNGRVLYTRWEYTDIPHFFSRLLFTMNPDGTEQRSYYGTNSYWPNGIFYAQPVPDHPTKLIGVVSGHHVARRAGELVLFDPARGRHEADGVVQRIPGRGLPVEPVINDRLTAGTWPRFLHPYPLSQKYFLVACRPDQRSRWGIYLVDVFDNMLLLHEEDGFDLVEPVPLRPRKRPPVIADKVDLSRSEALVSISDIYRGPGLKGVPRGTVKRLRLVAYHYAFRNMAEDSQAIGVDASWDTVKIVLGTVPVQEDGSALFRVPANTPFTIQPLDAAGKAVQLMRSWMVAMPGEHVSCIGCHASGKSAVPSRPSLAVLRGPSPLRPWYGPPRGFSFKREVQPVLDRYCVRCHDGSPGPDGKPLPDFTDRPSTNRRNFTPAYMALHRYVRRPGAETDYHLLPPGEYYADTSELVQLLEKGHYDVQLDPEAWDRLITWIDLNVPCHGTWHEAQGRERMADQNQRRRCLRRRYALIDEDPETVPPASPSSSSRPPSPSPPAGQAGPGDATRGTGGGQAAAARRPNRPVKATAAASAAERPSPTAAPAAQPPRCPGWPFDTAEARRRQKAAGPPLTRTIDLGGGLTLELVRIPAGSFVMGDPNGYPDERPPRVVTIDRPFWMGRFEVTNEQFARFDPQHDSRYIRTHGISSTRGYPLNRPRQPVVRVSWERAMAFCRWLSQRTGLEFTLPTEAQWEWACRAGTDTPFNYGGLDTDFSPLANLADQQVQHLRDYSHSSKLAWMPRDDRFDDGAMITAPVGSYQPNAWGLYDMHGNAAEWTRSIYELPIGPGRRMVVRGGSWRDRPVRARSACRFGYPPWMGVYNVGFRVVCLDEEPSKVAAARR